MFAPSLVPFCTVLRVRETGLKCNAVVWVLESRQNIWATDLASLTVVSPRGPENGSSVCCPIAVAVEFASHPTLQGGAVSRCSYKKGPCRWRDGEGSQEGYTSPFRERCEEGRCYTAVHFNMRFEAGRPAVARPVEHFTMICSY